MGRDARLNPNSQEGKTLEFTPATDLMGTRLAIGDLLLMTAGQGAFQPIYELVACKPDLRPGAPPGAHMLMFVSQFPAGIIAGSAVPGVRVAMRRDDPQEEKSAQEPPSMIVLPGGADTGRKEPPRG